mmetsp:Transcript_20978/g.46203  ORF Transcript_20978/g.46203 Transcript_20978/m.46203 type:complete len:644 (+) Transcript_20978:82-2013(+)
MATRPDIPEPLAGGTVNEVATLKDVPTPALLAKWLLSRGLDTQDWGKGDSKDVSKYWKELKLDEAGLELWRKSDGSLQPVRVVHVLRAKVCSEESYNKGIFLFNTWQQFGDGRKRTRNGLLSEKLSMSEMPFEEHMHEVCVRAVTSEEMQVVVDSELKIGPHTPAPVYDPSYECPLKVLTEHFVDHTIEVEISKSYPGLLTMYHLYTVDIICSGLPNLDFNTLEFEHLEGGKKKLKYVHAWVWMEWSQIQRYLFEGSDLKESKTSGSFRDPESLVNWLGHFGLDLSEWGNGKYKSVEELWRELEAKETQLELWGRHDGASLLMRVVHLIQLKIVSTDPRLQGRFLFQVWEQSRDGSIITTNKLLARKLSVADLPLEESRFALAAEQAVIQEFSHVVDVHYRVNPDRPPHKDNFEKLPLNIASVNFIDHRHDVEASPSFKGMNTMYHLYTMEVACDNLPTCDFGTINFMKAEAQSSSRPSKEVATKVHGWRWVTWQQTMDCYHAHHQVLQRRDARLSRSLTDSSMYVERLVAIAERMGSKESSGSSDSELRELKSLAQQLQKEMNQVSEERRGMSQSLGSTSLAQTLPPQMICKMATQTVASEKFLREAENTLARGQSRKLEKAETLKPRSITQRAWDCRCPFE